jgi:ABC-2 type transport system permease protein
MTRRTKESNNNYKYLMQQFTVTDFKLRYSHSVLGYIWSLLKPLMMFGVLYIVFSVFMRFGNVEHYRIYLLSGILLWTFFAETTSSGMLSILNKSSLLNKVSFPRIIIPVSSTLTNALSLIINMIVLAFFMSVSKVEVGYSAFFSVVILVELIIISLGISFFLCSLYLKFRDLDHLWAVVLQLGFWGTPIIYPIEIVPAKYQIIFKLNPMARLIHDFRMVIVLGQLPGLKTILLNFIMVIAILFFGYFIFIKRQKFFAEWI